MRFSLLASSRSSTACSAANNRPNRQDESERSAFLRGDHGFLAISRRRGRSGSACAPSSSREGTTVLTTAQAPATALATEPSSLTSACTASMPETSRENKVKDRIAMPASDPGGEIGIMKMAHNATAAKSRAAKYGHAGGHDAKVSRRLQLSHSHSAGDQSRYRAGASQTALVSRQGVSLIDTSSIESTVA